MLKKAWYKPELMTILTKETKGSSVGEYTDKDFPDHTPKGELTYGS